MLLALALENTHLSVGWFEQAQLRAHFTMRTDAPRSEDEYALAIKQLTEWSGIAWNAPEGIILGSVVPSVTPILQNALKKLTDAPLLTVGPGLKTGFPIRLDDPSQLGADLAANAAGARALVGFPTVIADFGSATTLSLLDRDGAYAGCCILPGIQMSLDALHGAELLPELSVCGAVPTLGKNTADSMRAGVLRGSALAVLGLASMQKQTLSNNEDIPLIVTGTYAEHVLPYLPKSAQHIPLLTLQGLCAIYQLNKKKS